MHKYLTPQKTGSIKSFWKWFLKNEKELSDFVNQNSQSKDIIKEFERKITYVSKRLGFVLGYDTNLKRPSITITANGYRRLFYLVEGMIEHAPKTKYFTLEAFIKPIQDLEPFKQGTDDPYTFSDFEFKISDIYFFPMDFDTTRKRMKIRVFLSNYRFHYDNDFLIIAVQIMIQNLIGEVNLKRSIADIELAQIPYNTQNLIPLYELNEYIDFLNKLNRRVKLDI
uniref:hypothetical protein n=1 Tax=Flavobacterium sp. TaxID=239 RepID=UPI00404A9B02